MNYRYVGRHVKKAAEGLLDELPVAPVAERASKGLGKRALRFLFKKHPILTALGGAALLGGGVALSKRSSDDEAIELLKDAGLTSLLRRGFGAVSKKLPTAVANLGSKMYGLGAKATGKLGLNDLSQRLAKQRVASKALLGNKWTPGQINAMRAGLNTPGEMGQVARSFLAPSRRAFQVGAGTIGAGLGLGGMAAHDLATGKLLGGAETAGE